MTFLKLRNPAAVTRPGVHATAIVGSDVTLEEGVTVGPYCVIEGRVTIGTATAILAHSFIGGTTIIGANCKIGPHASVGTDPQHRSNDGRGSCLVIEDNVIIREFATVHRATKPGLEHATRVGRGSLLMVGCHVAHDCRVGENATLANSVHLGGHVVIGDSAVLGGGTVVHQFVRVGRLSMTAGGEALAKDVMPFAAVFHNRHKGYNAIGCRRAGLNAETLHALRAAFREIHSHRSAVKATNQPHVVALAQTVPEVKELIEFIQTSRRGIVASAAADNEAIAV
jgi:UDP-N-acetylglucosamine acyltransferase